MNSLAFKLALTCITFHPHIRSLMLTYSHVLINTRPLGIGLLAYPTLNLMWFKFTVIWRFARFWALLDGVEVQENMVRGMNWDPHTGPFS